MKFIRIVMLLVINALFIYGFFLYGFDFINDKVIRVFLIVLWIVYDIYFVLDSIDRFSGSTTDTPRDIAPHDPNESKDYLDRF